MKIECLGREKKGCWLNWQFFSNKNDSIWRKACSLPKTLTPWRIAIAKSPDTANEKHGKVDWSTPNWSKDAATHRNPTRVAKHH
jgi:hypothetical protein